MRFAVPLLFCAPLLALAATSTGPQYVGAQVCAGCHADIARKQAASPMGSSWHGTVSALLPPHYDARTSEGPAPALSYEIRRAGDRFIFSLTPPSASRLTAPVETIVGGRRNGLSFLLRIAQLNNIPLARPALVEARYVWSAREGSLARSPGFETEKPHSLETAFGRALSPTFEQKCLTCHGEPGTLGAGKTGGVQCESCHGAGSRHLQSIAHSAPREGIVNPARLAGDESLSVCAQCHTGLTHQSDPLPGDLLVSSQVTALRYSECFIQSGQRITCISCHDPHQGATHDAERSVQACLSCHSTVAATRASICPVNSTGECIGCHMPTVDMKPFRLTDHWIRVHPEQSVQVPAHDPSLRSQVSPLREFLRIIVADTRDKADQAAQRLSNGEPFPDIARALSVDASAELGGYIGDTRLAEMDPKLTAAASMLQPGETSGVIDMGNRWMILHRMPRDFKLRADRLQQQASALKDHGDRKGALEKCTQALAVYPYFLRSLNFMAMTLAEDGNASRASEVIQFAARLYPDDAPTQFDLGLALGATGHRAEEISAYQRANALDPDLVAVYESLGAALCSAGQWGRGLETFRAGLKVDPLSAKLYYDLGLVLRHGGDEPAAKRMLALASAIDPNIGPHKR